MNYVIFLYYLSIHFIFQYQPLLSSQAPHTHTHSSSLHSSFPLPMKRGQPSLDITPLAHHPVPLRFIFLLSRVACISLSCELFRQGQLSSSNTTEKYGSPSSVSTAVPRSSGAPASFTAPVLHRWPQLSPLVMGTGDIAVHTTPPYYPLALSFVLFFSISPPSSKRFFEPWRR